MSFACSRPRVAGLDVHKESIAAAVRLTDDSGGVRVLARSFGTTPAELVKLRSWLSRYDVTHVAMEGTGVYWMPVFAALESAAFEQTVANAYHAKHVPGRKTDQSDAAWLAQLLASGLLARSFVPPSDIRQLRELTRARVHLLEDRTRLVNGVHRLLERAGVKLGNVVSDLQGVTAQRVLAGLAKGETDAASLAFTARGTLRNKRAELEAVLQVPLTDTDRFLLRQNLEHYALLQKQLEELEKQIEAQCAPYQKELARLCSFGVMEKGSAAAILAELGPDATVFASEKHVSAWAGLAPGQNESAKKKKRAGTREGNPYLKRILVQLVLSLSRTQGHDLGQWFRKKSAALGFKKAAVATAHKLLIRLWRMLGKAEDYAPPEPKPLSEAKRQRLVARCLSTLQSLGHAVELRPLEADTVGIPS